MNIHFVSFEDFSVIQSIQMKYQRFTLWDIEIAHKHSLRHSTDFVEKLNLMATAKQVHF